MEGRCLRILILTERFYPEEFIINDLVTEWSGRQDRIDVLTQVPSYPLGRVFGGYRNKLFQKEKRGPVTIYRFFTLLGYQKSLLLKILNYFNFALLGSLAAVVMGNRYDKVFIYQTGPLTMALPAVLIHKLYKKELTIWTQDVWPDTVYAYGFRKTRLLSFFLDSLVRMVYRSCRNIFVSCEGFIKRIKPYVPGRAIRHFPNWPLLGRYDHGTRVRLSRKFNFTFAGNIGKVQNLENVIRGFSLAVQSRDKMQLNLVGDGSYLAYLRDLVKRENVRNVVFWGRKALTEMPGYFNASDVLVISLKDNPLFALTIPSKFQTYLQAGKPIFCIMKGEVKDLVERYGIGLCSRPDDIKDIRDGFIRFFRMNRTQRSRYSKKSRYLLEWLFNRDKILADMNNIFWKQK
ncbi:MAG: glycosyltransferase family 4 protein [bacterium]|nr:glycosyltransferase family 4 protein [bacterium]